MDETQSRIIKLSNIIVSLVTLVRVLGALIDWKKDKQGVQDYMNDSEAMIDLALACIGSSIMIIFMIITCIFKRLEFLLTFSAEFSIICQIISFPFYDLGGGASLIIQYMIFQVLTIYIISNQIVFSQKFNRVNFTKKIPLIVLYGVAQFYLFQRSFNKDLTDFLGQQTLYYLLMTICVNFVVSISSFSLQVQRINSILREKAKNTRLTNDYQNIINNFAEGILISNCSGKISYINEELKSFIDWKDENVEEKGLNKKIFKGFYLKDETHEETWLSLYDIIKDESQKQNEQMESSNMSSKIRYKNYFELISPEYQHEEFMDDAMESSESSHRDDNLSVEVSKIAIQFDKEEQVLIIIKNISSIINYEKQKKDQKYQELLLGAVSHEMLTPLNSIIGLSGVIRKQYENQIVDSSRLKLSQNGQNTLSQGKNSHQKQSTYDNQGINDIYYLIKIINCSAVLMQFLVQDFIDLMNILKGNLKLNNAPYDLQKACFEVLELFEVQITSKALVWTFDMKDTPTTLYFDYKKYQQVILNLVQNAVKFTHSGGLDINLNFERIQICPNANCGMLKTTIKDTGEGMTQETQDNLFRIFGGQKKVNEEGVIRSHGIGLGLSICNELVTFLGGKITCESQKGKGSEFTFTINSECKQCRSEHENYSAHKSIRNHQTFSEGESSVFQFKATQNNQYNQNDIPYDMSNVLNDSKQGLIFPNEKSIPSFVVREPSKTPRLSYFKRTFVPAPPSPNSINNSLFPSIIQQQPSVTPKNYQSNSYQIGPSNNNTTLKKKRLFGDNVTDMDKAMMLKSMSGIQRKSSPRQLVYNGDIGADQSIRGTSKIYVLPHQKKSKADLSRSAKSSQFALRVEKMIDFSGISQSQKFEQKFQAGEESRFRKQSRRQSEYLQSTQTVNLIGPSNDQPISIMMIQQDSGDQTFTNFRNLQFSKNEYKSAMFPTENINQVIHESEQEDCSSSRRLTVDEKDSDKDEEFKVYHFRERDNQLSNLHKNNHRFNKLGTIQEEAFGKSREENDLLIPDHIQIEDNSNSLIDKSKAEGHKLSKLNSSLSRKLKSQSSQTLINLGMDSKANLLFAQDQSLNAQESPDKKCSHKDSSQCHHIIEPQVVKSFDKRLEMFKVNPMQISSKNSRSDPNLNNKIDHSFDTQEAQRELDNMLLSKREPDVPKLCSCETQILIVDDNMFNLLPLELILKQFFQVTVDRALNGQEAVNMFQKNLLKKCCNLKYKLVLMDLNMPVMDGYDATAIILQKFWNVFPEGHYPNGDQLFIVAITAFVNDTNIKKCYKVGMKEVLHKPINFEALGKVIDQYFYYRTVQQ
eukprot:403363564